MPTSSFAGARSAARSALLLAVAGAAAGCRSYEARPIDFASHASEVRARAADQEPIGAFAARLRQSEGSPPFEFSVADGLAAEEGEVLALFYNPTLRIARRRAGITAADMANAGLWEDPELGFDAADILSPDGMPFEWGVMLDLTLPVSGRLEAEKDRAGAAHAAELMRIVELEWATRHEVRRAWAEWSAAAELIGIVEHATTGADRLGSIAAQLSDAGEISRSEGRLMGVEASMNRAALHRARADERTARLALLELMGLAPDAQVDLQPSLAAPAPSDPSDAEARLIEHSPTLAVRRAEYEAAEHALRAAVRAQFPDITIGGGYGEEDDNRLLLGFSIPVPIFNGNRAAIDRAAAEREVMRAEAEAEFERLAHMLAAAMVSRDAAASQLAVFEQDIVPMLDVEIDEAERLAEIAELDVALLLEALTRRAEAKERLLMLRVEAASAQLRVSELLGPDDPLAPLPVEAPADPERTDAGQDGGGW